MGQNHEIKKAEIEKNACRMHKYLEISECRHTVRTSGHRRRRVHVRQPQHLEARKPANDLNRVCSGVAGAIRVSDRCGTRQRAKDNSQYAIGDKGIAAECECAQRRTHGAQRLRTDERMKTRIIT
jgi:hypothetical protein